MYGGMGLCTTCLSSGVEDAAVPTGGTAELESPRYCIHVCSIALPVYLQYLQMNRKYREHLQINKK